MTVTCLHCGTEVPSGARYCTSCGRVVTDPGAATVVALDGPPQDPLIGRLRDALANDYAIERELGRGGMAIVFKGTELSLGRPVALKVLPPEMAMTPSIAERFRREARTAASLEHPHIIPIYRVGTAAGLEYMAMKFVEGAPLDAIVQRQGALPLPAVLEVLRGATSALAAAHERGIVHRDIKSANILVERDGRVLLSDFGIARVVEDAGLTATGTVMGTPYFMSPEQCAGEKVGPQSDQYSLGVVAFQLLAGAVPFDAETLPGILHHHFFSPVPDLASIRDAVPAPLVAWIVRAMAKSPSDRFASTTDMLRELESLAGEESRREGIDQLRRLASGAMVEGVATRPFAATSATAGRAGAMPYAPQLQGTAMARPSGPVPPVAGGANGGDGGTVMEEGRGRRIALYAGALVLLVLLAGGGWFLARGGAPEATLADGIEAYRAGHTEAAWQLFQKATRDAPTAPRPHVWLGRMARERRDYATAGRELTTALRLAPNDPLALREMGALQLAQGNAELARRFFVRVVRASPNDSAAQGYLGCSLVRLGQLDAGRRFIERAGRGPWTACAPR